MAIPTYQVDAFTDRPFHGNPAGVCLLSEPKDAAWMQNVAMEMNLSETAFPVPRKDGDYDLRWFTPAAEVDLCGHATLATAHVFWENGILQPNAQGKFHTRSGLLTADRSGGSIELGFPADPPVPIAAPGELLSALGIDANYVGQTRFDLFVEGRDAQAIRESTPDFAALKRLGVRGVVVTARTDDEEFDFISRFFAPGVGIDEDPVTGSAHCALAPYWAVKLGRPELSGYQASKRGGSVHVRLEGDRVRLAGRAVTVLRGELFA